MESVIIGIESTAHTFGIGIVDLKGKIVANQNSVYKPIAGGIHPREAAEHHSKVAAKILDEAFKKAGVAPKNIVAVAVALGPGLGPCLRVGATVGRAIAHYLNVPLIPVNHAVAHIEIARHITKTIDPLIVYVSGGNTVILAFSGGRYRVFGETLDIALGNCIDVFAREVGLGFPGVPLVEEMAKQSKKFVPLPYVVKGQDVSFSGLLTAALSIYKEKKADLKDLCFSLIEICYDMLTEVAERALVHTGKRELVLTGGVARSPILQSKLREMCSSHGIVFKVVPPELAGDNGAMIAYTGLLAFKCGVTIPVDRSIIRQRWRIEEVDVPWRGS